MYSLYGLPNFSFIDSIIDFSEDRASRIGAEIEAIARKLATWFDNACLPSLFSVDLAFLSPDSALLWSWTLSFNSIRAQLRDA